MRLFLGVPIPSELRTVLAALQRRLRASSPGWRWVTPQGLHLTLRFLGEVDEELAIRGRAPWRAAINSVAPFEIGLNGLGRFPPAGRPRVLWVGIRDEPRGSLATLAERIERTTCDLGLVPERRAYQGHLTLARAARTGRPEAPPLEWPDAERRFACSFVSLMRSELGAGGARYTELEAFPLGGSGPAGR